MAKKAEPLPDDPRLLLKWLNERYTFGSQALAAHIEKVAVIDPLEVPPEGLVSHINVSPKRIRFYDAVHCYDCAISHERYTLVEIGCRRFIHRHDADHHWSNSGRSRQSGEIRQRRHELIAWIANVCQHRGWKW